MAALRPLPRDSPQGIERGSPARVAVYGASSPFSPLRTRTGIAKILRSPIWPVRAVLAAAPAARRTGRSAAAPSSAALGEWSATCSASWCGTACASAVTAMPTSCLVSSSKVLTLSSTISRVRPSKEPSTRPHLKEEDHTVRRVARCEVARHPQAVPDRWFARDCPAPRECLTLLEEGNGLVALPREGFPRRGEPCHAGRMALAAPRISGRKRAPSGSSTQRTPLGGGRSIGSRVQSRLVPQREWGRRAPRRGVILKPSPGWQ